MLRVWPAHPFGHNRGHRCANKNKPGRQIGHEARALMNAGQAGSTFWAPVVNLAREPRWGRNIEVPGEDPYHSGEYAEWFVKGFEQAPEDERYIQASACCKHYAANSMEHTTEGGQTHTRHDFSANITQQDLVSPLWPEPNVLLSMNH